MNLSEAFDFEENDKLFADDVPLEMKAPAHKEPIVLDMNDTASNFDAATEVEDGGETPTPKPDAAE